MCMFHMSFTNVLHARPLRICIRTLLSAPIDGSPGGFWDSAKSNSFCNCNCHCPGINLEWTWTGSGTTSSWSGRSMRLGTWKPLLLKRWPIWRRSSSTLSHGGVLKVLIGIPVRFLCKQAFGFCKELEANFFASGRPRAADWQKGLIN